MATSSQAIVAYGPCQVKQWEDGNVMVVVGSAQGGVSRMRFRVPLAPGSALDQIQACHLSASKLCLQICALSQTEHMLADG